MHAEPLTTTGLDAAHELLRCRLDHTRYSHSQRGLAHLHALAEPPSDEPAKVSAYSILACAIVNHDSLRKLPLAELLMVHFDLKARGAHALVRRLARDCQIDTPHWSKITIGTVVDQRTNGHRLTTLIYLLEAREAPDDARAAIRGYFDSPLRT